MKKDLVTESVELAKRIKDAANKTALSNFSKIVKEDIENSILEGNDEFNTEPDHPGGYDQDGGQKRIEGAGDSLEDEGKGPAIIEDDEPDKSAEMKLEDDGEDEKKEKVDEMDVNVEDDPEKKDGEDDELDLDLNSEFSESEEKEDEKKKEKVDESADEKKDDEKDKVKNENKQLRTMIAKLKTENAKLMKTVKTLNTDLKEVAIVNQKMAYMNEIFAKFPAISIENKRKIVEHFEKANSMSQVKFVYETVYNVVKTKYAKKSNTITESKKIVDAAKKNLQTTKNNSVNETFDRFADLAGLNG